MTTNITLTLPTEIAQWITDSPEAFGNLLKFGYTYIDYVKLEVLKSNLIQPQQQPQVVQQPQSSAGLGQIGEAAIFDILGQHYAVKVTAHESKSGDMSLLIDTFKILVEVKNYTSYVPTLTVDKFYRDLTTSNAHGAIFISLRSAINCVTKDFIVKYINAGDRCIPCIFIVSDQPAQILTAVAMLRQIIAQREESLDNAKKSSVVAEIAHGIGDSLDTLSKIRDSVQLMAQDMTAKVIKQATELGRVEGIIRHNIKKLKSEIIISNSNLLQIIQKIPNYNKLDPVKQRLSNELINFITNTNFTIGDTNITNPQRKGNCVEYGDFKLIFEKEPKFAVKMEVFKDFQKLMPLIIIGEAEIVKRYVELPLSEHNVKFVCDEMISDDKSDELSEISKSLQEKIGQ